MTVKKQKNGKWLCRIDKRGVNNVRKLFDTEAKANSFEVAYLAEHQTAILSSTDTRTIADLAKLWYKYHGINLSDGGRRKKCLVDIASGLNNPQASTITPEQFVDYRFKKIRQGLNEKTFNNHHGYLSAMYNKLRKLKVIDYPNPIEDIDIIKLQERQLSYLSEDQITTLLTSIEDRTVNTSTWYVAQLCLRTGARWGEAEQLKKKQLHNGMITYEYTKSKKTRSIPLDKIFYKDLMKFTKNKNPNDRIFINCIGAFRRAVTRTKMELPRGQNTHILRHSFASHFIMNGGNILTLRDILGHADIKQTMKYAHLAPEHLQDAIRLNPLA